MKKRKLFTFYKKAKNTAKKAGKRLVIMARKRLLPIVKFCLKQLAIRPRIKLVSRVFIVLLVVFSLTSQAIAYIKPKEAEIKINGQRILASEPTAAKNEAEVEISQAVLGRPSPFDFQMPVEKGYLSQGYSGYHQAFDIATAYNSPIKPLGSGVVEFAGPVNDGKGNIVLVDHGDGLKSLYAHMNRIEVGTGNLVTSNTIIGTVGLTGRTTGPHVHLEIYDNGNLTNPGDVLPAEPEKGLKNL